MLSVKTYLAPSKIHGIGLFAAEKIPTKSVVWRYNRFIDKIFSKQAFLRICQDLDPYTLNHLLNSTYKKSDKYFYLTDNARFINHSDMSRNISFLDEFTEIADRDIDIDEELLENYHLSYDADDFFFQEIFNIRPNDYLNIIAQGCHCNAHYRYLS
ncbi:MAG: SET domain-containing protein [Deltaproteobacteria bacterium]|nr:SET domain-containing protein [Deltaproteobacteria bacterium]